MSLSDHRALLYGAASRSRHMMNCVRFRFRRPLDVAEWTLHKPKVCADARGWKHTWLVELVSRAILYRHEKILPRQERLQDQTQEHSMWMLVVYSLISLDECVRLGSGFLWSLNMLLCFSGLQRGHEESPCEKDWGRSRSRLGCFGPPAPGEL